MTTKEKNSAAKSINENGVIAIIDKLIKIRFDFSEDETSVLDLVSRYWSDKKNELLDLAMDLGVDLSGLFIIEAGRRDEFWDVIFKYYDEHYELTGRYDSNEGVDFDYCNAVRVWPRVVQKTEYFVTPQDKECCGGKCHFVEPPKISIDLNGDLKLNVSNAGGDEVVYLQAGEHQRYTLKIINDELRKEVSKI